MPDSALESAAVRAIVSGQDSSVARRRYQRGQLIWKDGEAWGRWREDVIDSATGRTYRRHKKEYIAGYRTLLWCLHAKCSASTDSLMAIRERRNVPSVLLCRSPMHVTEEQPGRYRGTCPHCNREAYSPWQWALEVWWEAHLKLCVRARRAAG